MQVIKLNIVPSLIIESVKGETFIKGSLDRVSGENTTGIAYQEIAGDEQIHERKLARTMYSAIDELKGHLSDYLADDTETSGDNIVSSIDSNNDVITIELNVSNRFNKSYTSSLARLCSSYIENKMLVLWWTALRSDQASLYVSLLANDLQSIKRCFVKTAPSVPVQTYTSKIELDGHDIELTIGDNDDITYQLDQDCIDDIECFADNCCVRVERRRTGFRVIGINEGVTRLILYSRHNSSVREEILATVNR